MRTLQRNGVAVTRQNGWRDSRKGARLCRRAPAVMPVQRSYPHVFDQELKIEGGLVRRPQRVNAFRR